MQYYWELCPVDIVIIPNLKKDKPIGWCYNEIARRAKGIWILYLGDDDFITADYVICLVLRALDAIKKHPDKKIVNITSNSTLYGKGMTPERSTKSPTGMWLKSYVLENPFDETLARYVDTEMARRLNKSDVYFPAIASWQYGYYYRQHENNVSGNKFKNKDYDAVRKISHKIRKINVNVLNKLLPFLCDPIDHTELRPVINGASVDGLVSKEGSAYNINDGIPILMVDSEEFGDWNKKWEELQAEEFKNYLKSAVGIFSHKDHRVALKIHDLIISYVTGSVLDIGCGALETPSYMNPQLEWFGVDPYYGDVRRSFPFVQAIGEYLPFKDKTFDNIFIGTSLDHCLDPEKALLEARRVIKDGGKLLIWNSERTGEIYEKWLENGGMFDEHHNWAWDRGRLTELIERCGFKILSIDKLNDKMSYLFYGEVK